MNSRDKILDTVRKHQPAAMPPLPDFTFERSAHLDNVRRLTEVLTGIGGQVTVVQTWAAVAEALSSLFPDPARVINMIPALVYHQGYIQDNEPARNLEDVKVAVMMGHFAVAENGAVWITDEAMGDRALPFICEHLVLVVGTHDVVANMHDAYARVGGARQNFGTFIAGPSKTADIEQSLVLGAHGPKTLTLFLVDRVS